MKKTNHKLVGLAVLYLSTTFTLSGNVPVYAGTVENLPIEGSVALNQNAILTRTQLVNAFIKHITDLDRDFTLVISNQALKNEPKAFEDFWEELTKYPQYNDIIEHANIDRTLTYDYNGYFTWQVRVSYDITKVEAKKILDDVQPIIKTEKELTDLMLLHAKNLDRDFHINLDKSVLDLNSTKKYTAFWEKLYAIPEFNDISRYYKNFNSIKSTYNGYYKWIIKTDYEITKKEVNHLEDFVENWVDKHIKDGMSDEEKVRAINDYIVSQYRYTFGDNRNYLTRGKSVKDEKLGKYSVYSSFALLYKKGGVCDAKAKLFYRLATEAGLDTIYITGYVNKTTLHAWTMVKVDGKWYHVDATWNRGQKSWMNEYQYYNTRDYYLKGDLSMKKGHHEWDARKYPAANKDFTLKDKAK